jgi:phosphoadenosine phosphosulfate reductase
LDNAIINETIEKYKVNRFVVLFSGGKDSLTVAHYMHFKLGLPIELLYCKTGIGVKENLEYVESTAKKYGWKLTVIDTLPHETYEIFVKRFGFPYGGVHNAVMGFLKYHPMRKWYREEKKRTGDIIGFCSGRRRNESARRKRMKSNTAVQFTDRMVFVAPIHDWTTDQVWNYVKEERLEVCPVYDTLHMSGDCLCGAYGTADEYRMLEIFHPETFVKIRSLENKYDGKWGGNIKHLDKYQTKLEDLVCNECIYRAGK